MCTEIMVRANDADQTTIVARADEDPENLDGSGLVFIPIGFPYTATAQNRRPGLHWCTEYAYCAVDTFGYPGWSAEGFNDQGMGVSALNLPVFTEWHTKEVEPSKTMSPQSVVHWLLANYSSVDDVLARAVPKLQNGEIFIRFTPPQICGGKDCAPYHFSVHDKTGAMIVIEFAKADSSISKVAEYPQVYDNPVHVLTNAPPFNQQLQNLANYVNLSPYEAEPIDINGLTVQEVGEGSGFLGLPGDYTPPSRFARINALLHSVRTPTSQEEALNTAIHLLNNVDIPRGAVRSRSSGGLNDHTLWLVFKDLTHLVMHWRVYHNLTVRHVDCAAMFQMMKDTKAKEIFAIPLDVDVPASIDVSDQVKVWGYEVTEDGGVVPMPGESKRYPNATECPPAGLPKKFREELGIEGA